MLNKIDNLDFDFDLYLKSQSFHSNSKTLTIFGILKSKYNWFSYQNYLIMTELKYNMAAKQQKCDCTFT